SAPPPRPGNDPTRRPVPAHEFLRAALVLRGAIPGGLLPGPGGPPRRQGARPRGGAQGAGAGL
ncbi:MAG: hypothetical protein AVDCRST_MAG12-2907, partial [uncultured Rubrobacteraceae bacterium]